MGSGEGREDVASGCFSSSLGFSRCPRLAFEPQIGSDRRLMKKWLLLSLWPTKLILGLEKLSEKEAHEK